MERLDPCVSFETAQKLKDAGYPQADALWYWQEVAEGTYMCAVYHSTYKDIDMTAAPTALEILQTMGNLIQIYYHINMFFCSHRYLPIEHYSENPAEACAKMYLNYFAPKK
jgi:hypothetical protein